MTESETRTLAELIELIQSMSYRSRRDLILVGQGIVMGEKNRKEVVSNAETAQNSGTTPA